jgi:hypothetical protein
VVVLHQVDVRDRRDVRSGAALILTQRLVYSSAMARNAVRSFGFLAGTPFTLAGRGVRLGVRGRWHRDQLIRRTALRPPSDQALRDRGDGDRGGRIPPAQPDDVVPAADPARAHPDRFAGPHATVVLLTLSVTLFFTAMFAGSVALPLFVTRELNQPDSAVAVLDSVAAIGLVALPA